MKIADIKTQIENNTLNDSLIIFVLFKGQHFLVNQYIHQIAKNKNLTVKHIEELDNPEVEMFDNFDSSEDLVNLRVLEKDKFSFSDEDTYILSEKNLILIVNSEAKDNIKFDKNINPLTQSSFENAIVKVPCIEEWQVIDYIMSVGDGIQERQAQWLYKACEGDIDRIDQELNKLKIFNAAEVPYLFRDFAVDKIFSVAPTTKIFDFSQALSSKNISLLQKVYNDREVYFPNPASDAMKFIGLLYKEFKNITMYQTNKCPTPENTGIPDKQFWVYSKKPKVYSQKQLSRICAFLGDMDRRIKMGEFPAEYAIDYIIVKILNM